MFWKSFVFLFCFNSYLCTAQVKAPPNPEELAQYIATQVGKTLIGYDFTTYTENNDYYAVEFNGLRMTNPFTNAETKSFALVLVPVNGGASIIDTIVEYEAPINRLPSTSLPNMMGKALPDFWKVGSIVAERLGKQFVDFSNVGFTSNAEFHAAAFNSIQLTTPGSDETQWGYVTALVSTTNDSLITIQNAFEFSRIPSKKGRKTLVIRNPLAEDNILRP